MRRFRMSQHRSRANIMQLIVRKYNHNIMLAGWSVGSVERDAILRRQQEMIQTNESTCFNIMFILQYTFFITFKKYHTQTVNFNRTYTCQVSNKECYFVTHRKRMIHCEIQFACIAFRSLLGIE